MTSTETAGLLSDLILYPLKSAGGLSVPGARIDRWGLEFDRRWLVVDDKGVFLTQRQHPRMALIAPQLLLDTLVLNAPGMDSLELPLHARRTPTQVV